MPSSAAAAQSRLGCMRLQPHRLEHWSIVSQFCFVYCKTIAMSQAAQAAGITLPSSRKRKPVAKPTADPVTALPSPAAAGTVPASQPQQQLLKASTAAEPARKKARRDTTRLPPLPGTGASLQHARAAQSPETSALFCSTSCCH